MSPKALGIEPNVYLDQTQRSPANGTIIIAFLSCLPKISTEVNCSNFKTPKYKNLHKNKMNNQVTRLFVPTSHK